MTQMLYPAMRDVDHSASRFRDRSGLSSLMCCMSIPNFVMTPCTVSPSSILYRCPTLTIVAFVTGTSGEECVGLRAKSCSQFVSNMPATSSSEWPADIANRHRSTEMCMHLVVADPTVLHTPRTSTARKHTDISSPECMRLGLKTTFLSTMFLFWLAGSPRVLFTAGALTNNFRYTGSMGSTSRGHPKSRAVSVPGSPATC
mmetsp:Transcript_35587/g.87527  ORF Transcript_35587/g.87527 Transcript_35587/m.87527 type:complete len:201 (-) Transcript_35587:2211-2813(-)